MRSRPRLAPAVAILAALAAAAFAGSARPAPAAAPAPTLTVMTQNLFLGSGLEALQGIRTQTQLVQALQTIWHNVRATDFPARAEAIAVLATRAQPDVIGLQEAMLWRTQSPPDASATPATDVAYDFVQVLLDALARHGQHYRAVAVANNADLEFPDPLDGIDVRLTDRDAILVREGVTSADAGVHPFETNLKVNTPAGSFTVPRAWESVEVTVGGTRVQVVNTHLETADAATQVAQGKEIVAALASSTVPTVLLGDYNSKADRTDTATYGNLVDAGYADVWAAVHPGDPGLTCCHQTDLRHADDAFDERIDLVLVRNGLTPLDAEVVGEALSDRTPSGLWPSDHAGVVARLGVPAHDTTVEGALGPVRASVTGKRRAVTVTVAAREPLRVKLALVRGKDVLARRTALVQAGSTVLRLAVPRGAAGGPATLQATLADEAGNERALTRRVKLPPAP